jgi:tRNA (guanosine-2'-O-)-methyltransferase
MHELALPAAVCLVVGNEDHGISAGALRACDALAYLPQLGKVGSLNVATAASIALYEARRQEWGREP